MAEIELYRGRWPEPVLADEVAIVDDEDLPLVSGYRWRVKLGSTTGILYAVHWERRDGKTTATFMHQLIVGQKYVDHIDHDGLNNRRSNLRTATYSQNFYNRRKKRGAANRYTGVRWIEDSSAWAASIKIPDGKPAHLGHFDDEADAARARDLAAIVVHGEYALLNFPDIRQTEDGRKAENDHDRWARAGRLPTAKELRMAMIDNRVGTFSQWLDGYDGEDNVVAGVARIWQAAKGDRPRASAVQTISQWLTDQHKVHEDAMRASVRSYHESRGGRQATEAEVGAFRAMNSPGTIAPVPGDHEQLASPSPAVMAQLGRIERVCEKLEDRVVGLAERLDDLLAWTRVQDERIGAHLVAQGDMMIKLLAWTALQDERIKPITDLLGELAEAEQAPDQPELDGQGDPDYVPACCRVDQAISTADQPQATGSLWAQIAAPEPDMDHMAALGDPRLVEDE